MLHAATQAEASALAAKRQCHYQTNMSRNLTFPTMWYVRPAKAQTSLRTRTVLSEPLLVAR